MPEISQERLEQLERIEASQAAAMAGRLRAELSAALTAGKCRADAIEDAVSLLAVGAQATLDDQGRITKLSAGGKHYASASEAAAAFLTERAYLVAAPANTTNSAIPPTTQRELSPSELIAQGWAEKP